MIVMEYVRCGSLSMFVKEKGKLIPPEERHQLYKRFAMDIAEVSVFSHSLGLQQWLCYLQEHVFKSHL